MHTPVTVMKSLTVHIKSIKIAFLLTLFYLFGLQGSCFHPLLALHDLSQPKGDVFEVVWLGFLDFTVSLLIPEVQTHYSRHSTKGKVE